MTTELPTRLLGSTGCDVSAIGLGTWSMGGRWWGKPDDKQSVRTIQKAVDLGIHFFDTADFYGFGHSEELLAKALGKKRQDVFIATKVGLRWNRKGKIRHDLSREYIAQAVDASLQRLQTDVIDLYQIHWPDVGIPIEETAEALLACVQSGKVRFLGASNLSLRQLQAYRKLIPLAVLQPPLNLFERFAEVQLLPACHKENIGVVNYSTLCKGLLSGKFDVNTELKETVRRRDPLFNGRTFARNLKIVQRLNEYAANFDRTVTELAIAWVLAHPAISCALCGARRPEHLDDQVKAADWHLTHTDLQEIEKIVTQTEAEC